MTLPLRDLKMYWAHVHDKETYAKLADEYGTNHRSTVLRVIQRIERLAETCPLSAAAIERGSHHPVFRLTDAVVRNAVLKGLRRLTEPETFLAASDAVNNYMVFKRIDPRVIRLAAIHRHVATYFALAGWIATKDSGKKLLYYTITERGRETVKSSIPRKRWTNETTLQRLLNQGAITPDTYARGNHIKFLHDNDDPSLPGIMTELGNLADIVRMVCIEDLEIGTVEQRLGYSARSGKVVLSVALARI